MSTPGHVWWSERGDVYYRWDGRELPVGAAPRLALVSAAGARREVEASDDDAAPFLNAGEHGATKLSVEEATSALRPHVKGALERITLALSRLDPAFERALDLTQLTVHDGALDVPAVFERLLRQMQASPEAVRTAVATIEEDALALGRMLSFATLAGPLLMSLAPRDGDEPGALFVAKPVGETPEAMVTRVGAEVRAELDALAAERAPPSFEFADLVRPAGENKGSR